MLMNAGLESQGYVEVDLNRKGAIYEEARRFLSSCVIGQNRAVAHVARALQRKKFKDPNLPVATFLFAGPTGVGKTEMAKAIAQNFIGVADPAPLVYIDCQNYQERHTVSSLIGAPPGYVGHDGEPLLSQRKISMPYLRVMRHTNKKFICDMNNIEEQVKALQVFLQTTKHFEEYAKEIKKINSFIDEKYGSPKSVILFDEVEKAHPDFWDFILNIFSEGKMTFHNPAFGEVSFTNSIIIFTTNAGARDMQKVISDNKIGFGIDENNRDNLNQRMYESVKKALEKTFKPEFLGRIKENIIVFHPLSEDDQTKVLNVHLGKLQQRFSRLGMPLEWKFTYDVKKFILNKALNDKYGMRVLKQKIEKYVESAISGAIETGQIMKYDTVMFMLKDGEIKLYMKREKRVATSRQEASYVFGQG